ncbi:MAG TPA: Rap1a/Tai family immunity protein [Xanthobacteraceae bacterium]|jgi:hypothetical protein
MRGISVIAAVVLSFAFDYNCTADPSFRDLLDSIEEFARAKKLEDFCAKNPGHADCAQIEERQRFCRDNLKDDGCDDKQGSTILFWCESTALPESMGRCHAAMYWYATHAPKTLFEWKCVPPDVVRNTEQLRRIFIREAERIPEVLHLPAGRLFYYAITKAFPCRRPSKEIAIPR